MQHQDMTVDGGLVLKLFTGLLFLKIPALLAVGGNLLVFLLGGKKSV